MWLYSFLFTALPCLSCPSFSTSAVFNLDCLKFTVLYRHQERKSKKLLCKETTFPIKPRTIPWSSDYVPFSFTVHTLYFTLFELPLLFWRVTHISRKSASVFCADLGSKMGWKLCFYCLIWYIDNAACEIFMVRLWNFCGGILLVVVTTLSGNPEYLHTVPLWDIFYLRASVFICYSKCSVSWWWAGSLRSVSPTSRANRPSLVTPWTKWTAGLVGPRTNPPSHWCNNT